MKKFTLSLLIFAVMAGTLIGCGSTDTTTDTTTAAQEETTAAVTETPEQTAAATAEETAAAVDAPGEDNTVYGALTASDLTTSDEQVYKKESDSSTTLYNVEGGVITQITISFNTPLTIENDKAALDGYAHEFMASDAVLSEELSNKEFIYTSPSFNGQYDVIFSSYESETQINGVCVRQVDSSEDL